MRNGPDSADLHEATARTFCVIGGGAAGAAVVAGLLVHGDPASRIVWLCGREQRGRGVAYSTVRDAHILNVRTAMMGLLDDDTNQFSLFLSSRGLAEAPAAFVPRRLFGDYIEETLTRLQSDGLPRPTLEIRDVEAASIHVEPGDAYRVGAADGSLVLARHVLVAVGALPPVPLAQVDTAALQSGRYLANPWAVQEYKDSPRRVFVIGSRLTAIDTILTIAERWPDAQIVALSRHGCLPARHERGPLEPFAGQHHLNDELMNSPSLRRWVRVLRETVKQNEADPRAVIDGLRSITNTLWSRLSSTDKGRFLRHVRWLWDVLRHRVPPQTAQRIDDLRASGQLRVVKGRIQSVRGTEPTVTYRLRETGAIESTAADLVVQATGFESTRDDTRHRLLNQLFNDGLAQPDEHGLGIRVDASGTVIDRDGKKQPGLHAIGVMLRGTLWESASMPEIRLFAGKLAHRLSQPEETTAGAASPRRTMLSVI